MFFRNDVILNVLNLPRAAKRLISVICDLILCLMCVLVAFYLRLDIFVLLERPVVIAAWVSVCSALPVFWLTGLYRTIFRYSAASIFSSISKSVTIYGLLYFFILVFYSIEGIPRSIGIIQPMLLFFGVVGSRLFIKFILATEGQKKSKSFKKILIYGAGNSGQQLANSLTNNVELKVIGFLDDDERLHGQQLQQLFIYNPDHLKHIIKSKNVELVLLALPTIDRFKRNQILEKLRQYKLTVQTLPSPIDIIDGKVTVSDIKELDLNDILNRELVLPKQKLIQKNIKDQIVLVTGAGGSIGSELCRQIAKANPKVLILCELNEFSLYKIYDELISSHQKLKIIPLLVNIQDQKKMNEILKIFKVETFYHAAAYKHVPLVESNICEGVLNNVFGTYSVVRACLEQRVLNFVLISSDKAVRPTNVMGATKRLSELCLQALYHQHRGYKINMSMVRFGNVLESSGSIIPKFKQQIKEGRPVTLTHPEVTRYFMTVTEAAQLVIQAGAMSKNCDVFILEMGKSVKIKDLIDRIIFLSGLSIRDKEHPEGDVEIEVIGLRPGEKLYEELLIGDNPQPTTHKKIKRAQDPYVPFEKLKKDLDALRLLCNFNKVIEVKTMLEKIVTTYKSKYNIVDYMHTEQVYLNIPTTKNTSSVTTTSNKVINIKK